MDTWVDGLIKEYNSAEKQLRKHRETLDDDHPDDKAVAGMISDLNYSLEWMRRGRRPGNRRGAESRSVYERTVLLDPNIFPSLDIQPQDRPIDERDKRKLLEMLWELSARERQCYILHMSYGMSYAEIAKEIGVSRSSVQKFIERAKAKISKKIS